MTIIPTGKFVNFQCNVNLDNTTSNTALLIAAEEVKLPEKLETTSTVVPVRPQPN